MLNRVQIYLSERERQALLMLADLELRSPADQARVMIRAQLESLGLLETSPACAHEDQSQDDDIGNDQGLAELKGGGL